MTTQPSFQRPPSTTNRPEILDALLATSQDTLRHQAFRHSDNPESAEEALQDACLQFLRRYEGRPGVEALRWMQTTTKRCAWAISRRERRRPALALSTTDAIDEQVEVVAVPDERPGPAAAAERREDHQGTVSAFEQLKPDERTALILLGLGCSYAEIGELRDWTHTKVNRCVSEGRAAIRARIT
jgi:RNA polymerase sigma factor (sigma-70 family)